MSRVERRALVEYRKFQKSALQWTPTGRLHAKDLHLIEGHDSSVRVEIGGALQLPKAARARAVDLAAVIGTGARVAYRRRLAAWRIGPHILLDAEKP